MEDDTHAIRLILEALFDPSGFYLGLFLGICTVGGWYIFHLGKDMFDEKD